MEPAILHKVFFEVVRDLSLVFHAHERLGPARIAAAVLLGRSLQDGNPGAPLQGRGRRGEPRDPHADDNRVICADFLHPTLPG